MYLRRKGYPEEGEFVLCTITKIFPHGVFAVLDEYDNKSGFIHISEVSPGRIRNIRDFVQEKKKVVCVILKIDRDRGHIDLSLRRVNAAQKRNKNDEIKREQKAEKIIDGVAFHLKEEGKIIYPLIAAPIMEEYDLLSDAYFDVVSGELDLAEIGVPSKYVEKLNELVLERIKLPEVRIDGHLFISSYESDGVNFIKTVLTKIEKMEGLDIKYLGAGKYSIYIVAGDYKAAEKIVKQMTDSIEKDIKKNKSTIYKFERVD